ncbi:hypothetical protein LBMAG53_27200 [Planctomycetota bacterium]|nr:hypothetical protein LBMAG53_27200 [Planctomycetota bacterium]
MRPVVLLIALAVPFAAVQAFAADPPADTQPVARRAFVNARVSSRQIAFNQVVRLEFTTMPRQIPGIDIAAAVANAVALDSKRWRSLATPIVVENEKTRTVAVTLALIPRVAGDVQLPAIPLTWLSGEQLADLGVVTVAEHLALAGDTIPQPKETIAIAGIPWGAKLLDLTAAGGALAKVLIDRQKDRVTASPQDGLTLIFRHGELGEATLVAKGLTLERAREQFMRRWGMPHLTTEQALTWYLGWTTITATVTGDGVTLGFVREDSEARRNQADVEQGVFGVLDGAAR